MLRRPLDGDGAVAERHDADADRARLLLDERAGGRLGRLDARGLEVVGPHAVRHVEGEDHRAFALRQRRSSSRAREREADERERRGEERERHVAPPADAALPVPSARAPRTRAGPRGSARRRSAHAVGEHQRRDDDEQTSSHGEANDISGAAVACATRRCGRARGRGRRSVETSWRSTPARRVAARSSASRCSPAARSRRRNSGSLESTRSCSPVSASSTTITPASGSSNSRGSTRRMATTSWRSVSRSSGRSHPGAVMKSETSTTSERRRIVPRRVSSRPVEVGDAAVRPRRAQQLRVSASTWLRRWRGGIVLLDLVVVEDRADAVAAAREQPGDGRRELAQDELLRPVDRAEAHRRRAVEQQPGRQLAVLGVLRGRTASPCAR